MSAHERLLYPDTLFIDEYLPPRPAEMARSILVVDHFSGGNPFARQLMAEVANLDISTVPFEDQGDVAQAIDRVDDLMFDSGFSEVLALGDRHYSDPDLDEVQFMERDNRLVETWALIRMSNRLADGYQKMRPLLGPGSLDASRVSPGAISELMTAPETLKLRAAIPRLGNALLYLDTKQLDPSTARPDPGHPIDSVFRQAVCDETTKVGVAAFDVMLAFVRTVAYGDYFAAGIDEVQASWSQWHPETPFFDQNWEKNRKRLRPAARVSMEESRTAWSRTVEWLERAPG